ncbi:hypothetical protein PIB30_047716 [Stylosanthes scabra]|uniref:Uncharacterized protein n=1 Tax=Stylosanthes scabra TaxID=79078 RepID=A0ABU6UFI7_9FABA|nr:hypothetical protein [Stylosanthes scabra]
MGVGNASPKSKTSLYVLNAQVSSAFYVLGLLNTQAGVLNAQVGVGNVEGLKATGRCILIGLNLWKMVEKLGDSIRLVKLYFLFRQSSWERYPLTVRTREDLGYDSEPERTLLRRRREARRARQAALEEQFNMGANNVNDDDLNLNNNRVTLGQYINPTAESCGSTIRRPAI